MMSFSEDCYPKFMTTANGYRQTFSPSPQHVRFSPETRHQSSYIRFAKNGVGQTSAKQTFHVCSRYNCERPGADVDVE